MRHCVSGALTQEDETGGHRPIAFYSSKLNGGQRNWAVIETEAFATLLALKKFRAWVCGCKEVVVYSDHNSLLFLTQAATKSVKLMRWSLALSEYPVRWEYKRGSKNTVADALSRLETDI